MRLAEEGIVLCLRSRCEAVMVVRGLLELVCDSVEGLVEEEEVLIVGDLVRAKKV